MSYQISSNTYNLNAYLTEIGRTYLFGFNDKTKKQIRFDSSGQDLFLPKNFSINDTDVNYQSSQKLSSGEIPVLAGNRNGTPLKTVANSKRKNFIINSSDFNSNVSFDKSSQEIKDSLGTFEKIKINIEQVFENIDLGSDTFRIFVIDNKSNYANYKIDGFSIQDEYSINKYGAIVNIKNKKNYYSTLITIISASTLLEGNDNKVTLGITPLNNCSTGIIPETEIKIIGTIPQTLGIGFTESIIEVENKQEDGTLINYVTLRLTDLEAKKQKIANVKIDVSNFLQPFRNNPVSISLLNSCVYGDNLSEIPTLYSKDYIATLLEKKQDIPLTFDYGTNSISFKIEKPFLNIKMSSTTTDLKSVITFLNGQKEIKTTQITTIQNQITEINNNINFINNEISNNNLALNNLRSQLETVNQHVVQFISITAYNFMSQESAAITVALMNMTTTLEERIELAKSSIRAIKPEFYNITPSLIFNLQTIINEKTNIDNQITVINNRNNFLNGQKTEYQNQITTLEQQIVEIKNTIVPIDKQIEIVQSQLDKILNENKNIVFTLTNLLSNNVYINTSSGNYSFFTYKIKL